MSYSPLSVDRYTSKTALEPYWNSGQWTPTPAEQYIHSHRYIGEPVLTVLQAVSLIPASEDFLQSGGQAHPLPRGDIKVLDACCGPGVLQSFLYEHKGDKDISVVAADLDEAMLEEVKRKAAVGNWQNIEVKHMDVMDTGYPDGHFTHILLNFAIQYFQDSIKILKEFHRLLRPGGLVFFSSPVNIHAMSLIHAELQKVPNAPPFPPRIPAFESNREDTATALLERAGFQPMSATRLAFSAPMENAQMAAEASSPVVFNIGRGWSNDVKRAVMEGMRKTLTEKYSESEVPYPQEVLIAIGQKPL